jgi:hypothetical protein
MRGRDAVSRGHRWRRAAALAFLCLSSLLGEGTPRADWLPPVPAPLADRPLSVADYTLRATLDPVAHAIHGEGSIRFTNRSDKPVSELWVHLYLNAFKNERSVFLREPIGAFRGGTRPASWGTIDVRRFSFEGKDLWPSAERSRPGDDDETDARVPLPRPVAPGETVEIAMIWDDHLPSIVERTGFSGSFHFAGQWFPKLAKLEKDGSFTHFPFHHLAEFYADYGRYDVTVDVPEAYRIGATGKATETKVQGGRRIARHVQEDVHDFAFTAWDKFEEREERIDGVAVRALFPRGYEAVVERELETLRFALPHFRAHYGPYPYDVLTVVHPPDPGAREAGGMEYPTLITTGGPWYTPRAVGSVEHLTIHEFGHQYFYGLLATNELAWPFLDEGLNSYAESEALAAWKGEASGGALLGLAVSDSSVQSVVSHDAEHDEAVAKPASEFFTGRDYGRLVYARTATILETLARTYGKESMDRAMGRYARAFRFQHPEPKDLLACIEGELGKEAAENARVALFEKGWVDYSIGGVSRGPHTAPAGVFDEGGKRETRTPGAGTGYGGTISLMRRGTLKLPVDVRIEYEDGQTETLHFRGDQEAVRLAFEHPKRPRAILVDPDHRVLLDGDRSNNVFGEPGTFKRTMDHTSFWVETLLGGLVP